MINSLQSLRFVFAIMILHHHYYGELHIMQTGLFPVAFFFILSGFLMSMGYSKKVLSDSFVYRKFIYKRIVKLFPLNAICVLLPLAWPTLLDIVHKEWHPLYYIYTIPDILMIQSWIPIEEVYFSGNAPAWFLSDILFCYMVFPLVVKLLNKRIWQNILLLFIIAYFVVVSILPNHLIHSLVYVNPIFRLLDFVLGIELFIVLRRCSHTSADIEKQNTAFWADTSFEFVALLSLIISFYVYPFIPINYGYVSLFWVPSILIVIVFASSEGGAISKCLSCPFLVYLGSLSFPFYMFHCIVLNWYRIIELHYHFLSNNHLLGFFICAIITLIFALCYNKYLEPIIINKLRVIYE